MQMRPPAPAQVDFPEGLPTGPRTTPSRLLDRFEARFLTACRVLFSVVACLVLLGFVLGGVWLAVGYASSGADADDYFEAPDWAQLRRQHLPVGSIAEAGGPAETAPGKTTAAAPAEEIVDLVAALDAMYERDPSWSFTISPARLEQWLGDRVDLAPAERQQFNRALLAYGRELAADPVLDRLADDRSRINTITELIESFTSEYEERLRYSERQAAQARLESAADLAGRVAMVAGYAAGAVALLLGLMFLILLTRVESHLQRIAYRDE